MVLKEDGSPVAGLHKTRGAQRRELGSGPRFPATDTDPTKHNLLQPNISLLRKRVMDGRMQILIEAG